MGKALSPEHSFRPEELLDGELAHQIIEQGWDTFTDQQEPTVIAIVKVFYDNTEDKHHMKCWFGEKLYLSVLLRLMSFIISNHQNRFISESTDFEKVVTDL